VQKEQINHRPVVYSRCGKYIYHISIIDFLQTFRAEKKAEFIFKRFLYLGRSNNQISTVNPDKYARRFFAFMKEKVFIKQEFVETVMNPSVNDSIIMH